MFQTESFIAETLIAGRVHSFKPVARSVWYQENEYRYQGKGRQTEGICNFECRIHNVLSFIMRVSVL